MRSTISRRNYMELAGGVGASSLAGCLGQSTDDGVEIEIATTFEPEHVMVQAAEEFKQEVEGESDGDIEVTVTPGGAYGSEEEITDLVSEGSLQMHVSGTFPFYFWAPEYYFVNVPFVFTDWEQVDRVFNSDKFQPAYDLLQEEGNQTMLGNRVYRGERHFLSNQRIETIDDVQGINLRLPDISQQIDVWNEIGVNPTTVAYDELYSALQTGVADAAEGSTQMVISDSLHEVLSNMSRTSHLIQGGSLYANWEFIEGLDQSYSDMIFSAADSATRQASEMVLQQEENELQQLPDEYGMEVNDANTEEFANAAQPVLDGFFEEDFEGTLDEWRNV